MKPKILLAFVLLTIQLQAGQAVGADNADGTAETPQYLRVNIDRVVIDTEAVVIASGQLATSIDRLALAIQQLSANSEALSEEEKAVLLKAVSSVDQASLALAELARQLPQTAQNLGEQLPRVISDARQPIADLSRGLQSAREGVVAIAESLPQATENAKQLVDSTLDSALMRLSTYTIILIAVLALALIGVMWFVYRQYLHPLAQKLDALTGAPEHFAAMSRYMKETSDNLVALQPAPDPEPAVDDSPAPVAPQVKLTGETTGKPGPE